MPHIRVLPGAVPVSRLRPPASLPAADLQHLADGLAAFRGGDFYLAHDLWEEVWQGYRAPDRRFLQGLIHIAVGSYHATCGNAKGMASQLRKAIEKISPFGPEHWGLDVEELLSQIEALRAESEDVGNAETALQDIRQAL